MIHVDDFIIAAPTNPEIEKVVEQLRQFYDMKCLGEPTQYLNCALRRDYASRTITMTQSAYVQKVLHVADVTGFKDIPLPVSWKEDNANVSTVLDDEGYEFYQKVGWHAKLASYQNKT